VAGAVLSTSGATTHQNQKALPPGYTPKGDIFPQTHRSPTGTPMDIFYRVDVLGLLEV